MAILYSRLGTQKKLNQIVFAGTHDAGITTGKGWAKTQTRGIGGQARAGARIFDVRITGDGSSMKAYHGIRVPGPLGTTSHKVQLSDVVGGGEAKVKGKRFLFGNHGLSLDVILDQAKGFVTDPTYNGEFLLLKFDKCGKSDTYDAIAQVCRDRLDNVMFAQDVNLNESELRHLAGKVVILFPHAEAQRLRNEGLDKPFKNQGRILPWRNLFTKGDDGTIGVDGNFTYDAGTSKGLVYYGKGESKKTKLYKNDKYYNIKNQYNIMSTMNTHFQQPGVMGMMYWTLTGVLGNILTRNDKLWNSKNTEKLKLLWAEGLGQATLSVQMPRTGPDFTTLGSQIQSAIPNIVMLDDASEEKGQVIYDLNWMTYADWGRLADTVELRL